MTVDQFVAKYNGKHIDEDGYYGAQCWDVSARYAREVVGCPSFPTGSGGAEGLFRIFSNPIPQYFNRIANNHNDPNQIPQKGDIIVWQTSFSPPWGHTAVCISANKSGVTVLEQNGNNPGGVSYIKTRGWSGISGWLRPKQQAKEHTMLFKEAGPARRILISEVLGRDRVQAHSDKWTKGFTDQLGNRDYAEVSQIFWSSQEGKNYRAHKDTVEAFYDTGKKQITDANNTIIELRKQIAELGSRPTKAQLDKLNEAVQAAEAKAMEAQAELQKKANADKEADEQASGILRAILRFLKLDGIIK